MSTINVIVRDQILMSVTNPIIASGDIGLDKIHVDFDVSWNGFSKFAVFVSPDNTKRKVSINSSNECVIPEESISKDGWMKFGFYGINEDKKKTSTLIEYHIVAGATINEVMI